MTVIAFDVCRLCGEPLGDSLGPGPRERRWQSRLRRFLTGRWPASVVSERLMLADLNEQRERIHYYMRHAA